MWRTGGAKVKVKTMRSTKKRLTERTLECGWQGWGPAGSVSDSSIPTPRNMHSPWPRSKITLSRGPDQSIKVSSEILWLGNLKLFHSYLDRLANVLKERLKN